VKMRFLFKSFLGLAAAIIFIGACAPKPAIGPVRVALLPIIEALPLYAAQDGGLFQKHGVEVTFITAASAAERDQLVASGQADALINDLVSTGLYNHEKTQIQVVRQLRAATKDEPVYRILAAKGSGLNTPDQLSGIKIGISEGSVIEYVTDRLLIRAGLKQEQINKVAVPKIPDRLALLASGELKAATLPEPFSTLAVQQGAVVVLDDRSYPEYGTSVFSFRKAVIDARPETVKSFVAALNEAVDLVNQNPEKYRDMLNKYKLLPGPVAATYKLPTFPPAIVPSQAQFDDVVDWEIQRGLLASKLNYTDSINSAFLR